MFCVQCLFCLFPSSSDAEVFSVLWVPIAFFSSCGIVTRDFTWEGRACAFPALMLPVNETHTLAGNATAREEVLYAVVVVVVFYSFF
jgi:hypothetical protein